MPIYEYVCRKCSHPFEELVSSESAAPSCPACRSAEVTKVLSVVSVGKSAGGDRAIPEACRSCGDPRGPGACGMN
ncbi:MAG: zinc ribbon domain-containing protein [Deltaproteobacteria bacterium]|nr:zinc ribbon domain-containing protein [Deltaproteobacteria bacterium]